MDRLIRARAVLAELDALGLTVEDLLDVRGDAAPVDVPTVAAYVGLVASSYKSTTRDQAPASGKPEKSAHGRRTR